MSMPHRPGRLWLLLVMFMLVGWVVQVDSQAIFGRLSWFVHDVAQQWLRPAPRTDPRIVIVDIDDATLQARGRWPWPRERLAALIEDIQHAQPAQVGLDILLPDPGTPSGDADLATQLHADNVVAATAFGDYRVLSGDEEWPRAARELKPVKSLMDPVGERPRLGHISPHVSDDGRIHWLYPRLCGPSGCRSVLALAMLEQFVGLSSEFHSGIVPRYCVAGFCLRLDTERRLLLPYLHPSRFSYLSADEVMAGRHRERLQDSLVLVGTSAAGLGDLVPTPRGALTPGIELHAIMLAAWLDSTDWVLLPHARLWLSLGVLSMAMAAWFGLAPVQAREAWRSRLMLGAIVALVVLPPVMVVYGYWLDPLPWWLAALGTLLTWLGVDRWRLWRRHRRLYRTFGAYVPRNVLRQLAEQGEKNGLDEAQRMPLVIMFTDIRGFTALSDTLSPERLTLLTNHIFSELTEVVHRYDGTLDKYIGDAMMAFWGAPLAHRDDPLRALQCALEIQHRLVSINAWCQRQGFPDIAMNIGMEAGEVTVGNLGSRQRRAYTAMGRAVNLAARLEELAAAQSQPIMIGPGLTEALGDDAPLKVFVEVDLKGLRGPVSVSVPVSRHVDSDSACISSPDT